jgi:iron complex outermembrane recepter protein
VLDQNGQPISSEFDAINNISTRDQYSYGGDLQTTFLHDLFGRENQFIVGLAYYHGFVDFNSSVEIGRLREDRSTTRTGLFVPEEAAGIDGQTRTWSVYFTDTFALTPTLFLTIAGRYNDTRVRIRDLTGGAPELNGQHEFERFNPAVGFTYAFHPAFNLYAGYSESSRAPTAVELACADAQAPCNLPNAFLADPPLEQVVAKSYEGGLRGKLKRLGGWDLGELNWNLGVFHTTNEDDIIFQSTGGISANEGFFANIGMTSRRGIEAGINGHYGRADWFLNYSLVEATFEESFLANSPNHPLASDLDGDGDEDDIRVTKSDRIPGIPAHSLKIGADVAVTSKLTLGGDLRYNSGQFLRGDEANLLDTLDGYAIVNLRGEYRINQHLSAFALIENLFDTDYETFGLLGEPQAVLGPAFDDPRFLSPGAPIGGWVGLKLSL